MRNIIHLEGEINTELFNYFVDTLNSFEDKSDITVYLSSLGGKVTFIPAFKDLIERYNVKLVAYGELYSSALIIFFHTNVRREILDETIGMHHQTFLEGVRVSPLSKKLVQKLPLEKQYKESESYYSYIDDLLGLSKKDKKDMLKGKDFYFSTSELREALKKVQNNLVV